MQLKVSTAFDANEIVTVVGLLLIILFAMFALIELTRKDESDKYVIYRLTSIILGSYFGIASIIVTPFEYDADGNKIWTTT